MARTFGFGGPVGLFHATLGFSVAVLVARVWEYVAQEAHCTLTCPGFTSEALRLHHFYYGIGLFVLSLIALVFARRQRPRWDSSLFLGIGTGLAADEIGLLFLGIPYSHPLSILVLAIVASMFLVGMLHASIRDGAKEFRTLDHSDVLTVLAVLLGVSGVLYLDRPKVPSVEILGGVFWFSALTLLLAFGATHFHQTFKGPG